MTTTRKTAENLVIGDVLIIKNQAVKVVGRWGLAFSLDMYVTSEAKATSYTTNRKINLSVTSEFDVFENNNNLSLFEINCMLTK